MTTEGGLHCFGARKVEPKTLKATLEPLPAVRDGWTRRAGEILRQGDPAPGYGVVLGVASGRLVEELIRQSDLHVKNGWELMEYFLTVR